MAELPQASEEAQILITFWKRYFVISDIVLQNNTYRFQIYLQGTFLFSNNSKNIQGTVKRFLKSLLKFQLISEILVLLGNQYNELIDV